MKLSSIEISDYRQFKDLKIDLTYPQGHAKAGQPLDKVCIIGQNGTGKTTILKMIHDCFIIFQTSPSIINQFQQLEKFEKETHIKINGVDYSFEANGIVYKKTINDNTDKLWAFGNKLIYIPTNSYTNIGHKAAIYSGVEYKNYFQLTPDDATLFSIRQYEEVLKYNQDLVNFSLSLFNRLREGKNVDMKAEQELWDNNNHNPLEEVTAFVDKLLAPAGVKLQPKLNNTFDGVGIQFISLKNGEIIPVDQLSSGTKNIFWTAWSLHQQIENESIILIDEPENSLYPNLQREIVPTYTSLRPEAETQFFFATHSPVIASCFEPWEIVDLELDDDNQVFRHLYYEGENHVNNYTVYPQYLRWDSIMNKVFDINFAGNEKRYSKLEEFSKVRAALNELRKEGKTPDKNPEEMGELFAKYQLLLKQLDWKIENTNL